MATKHRKAASQKARKDARPKGRAVKASPQDVAHDVTLIRRALGPINVNREVALFRKSKNGAFAWEAYRIAREWGCEIPADVLAYLDGCAMRLQKASTHTEVAGALRIANPKGGPQGGGSAKAMRRNRDMLEELIELRRECRLKLDRAPRTIAEAESRVAAKFRTTPGNVHTLWQAWRRSGTT